MAQEWIFNDTTSTRIRQQQQNQEKNEYQNQEQQNHGETLEFQDMRQHNYYYNNYNNNPARVCAGARAREGADELPGPEVMELIADAYRANISDKITRVAATIIEDALKNGMEPDTVILAIEETGMASRPSPYYLRAVMRNWAESGVVLSRAQNCRVQTTKARPWWK